MQIEAGETFNELLKEKIITKPQLINQIHYAACKLLKTWSALCLNHWKKVFIKTFILIEDQTVRLASVTLVLGLSEKAQPLATRVAATYLLGKISFVYKDT